MDMLPPGLVLAERYRIEEIVGVGAMGMVYRARDLELDHEVAVKVMRSDQQIDDQTLERFRQEVLAARRVSHPNVVRLHDIGRDGNLLFLTMDYVPGRTLREWLADDPPDIAEAIRVAAELADALAAAHEQDVVHRDLKPANVLIDAGGHARIMDFGVARSGHREGLTVAGEVVGTPDYLAPEQVRGEQVDHRADIYALGLVLCEMLGAPRPGSGSTLDEMLAQRALGREASTASLPGRPPAWLVAVVRRCLAARPEERYASARQLAEDLRHGQARRRRRRRGLATAGALLALLAVVFAAWQLWPDTVVEPDSHGQLAVLPLGNLSGDEALGWTQRGLAEALADGLAEHPRLSVTDPLRVFRLIEDLHIDAALPSSADRHQLFELLDLDWLVTGRLLHVNDSARIEIRLHADAEEATHQFAAEVPRMRPLEAIPELMAGLFSALGDRALGQPPLALSTDSLALAHYDEGLSLLARGQSLAAIDALERAVGQDETFAGAWTRLASSYADAGYYDRAVASAERAVNLLADDDSRLALEARASLAMLTGHAQEARALLERLVDSFPGDVDARIELGRVLADTGELAAAERHLSRATALDSQHPVAWYELGRVAILAGDPARAAEDYLVRALVIANRSGSQQLRGDIYNALGIAHQRLDEAPVAADFFAEAVDLRQSAGDLSGVAATRANLAHLALLEGDFERSREELAAATEACEAIGDRAGMADLYNQLGVVEEEVGDYRAALDAYREALRLREQLGGTRALIDSYNNVAFAYIILGEYDHARQFNRSALDLLADRDDPASRLMALETRGYLMLAFGAWSDALEAFLEALEIARGLGYAHSQAVAQGGIGQVAHYQGRFAAASEAFDQAYARFLDLGDRRGAAVIGLRRVELALSAFRHEQAADQLAEVEELLEGVEHRLQHADFHRLSGRVATYHHGERAGEWLQAAEQLARESGSKPAQLATRAAQVPLLPRSGGPPALAALVGEAERLGDAALTLTVLAEAAGTALESGDADTALSLARRGLRPPLRIASWKDNWRLHWILAQSEEEGEAAESLDAARSEVWRLLEGMPEPWRASFVDGLPEELKHVEVEGR